MTVSEGRGQRVVQLNQGEIGLWRGVLALDPKGGALVQGVVRALDGRGNVFEKKIELNQQAVDPGRKARISFGGGAAVLDFAAGSAYSRFFPQAQAFKPDVPAYFTYGGAAFAFGPESVALDERAQVLLRYPATVQNPEKLAVYWDGGDGKWVFAGNALDRQARLVGAQSRTLGRCALLFDEEAPSISGVHPADGHVVAGPRPNLGAKVTDRGAGIGSEQDVVLKLDGKAIIAEYDPDADTVKGHLFTDLGPGTHTLEVQITDQSGNQSAVRSVFTIE